MKILAIDTTSEICSVAILDDTNLIFEESIEDGLTHSQKLMPLIKKAFDKVSFTLQDIDLIACCNGPGSFTGIRIGISTVKAFSDVYSIPCIGITSLESLAYNIKNEGYITSLIDARNDQVYFSLFKNNNGIYSICEEYKADHIDEIIKILNKYKDNKITFVGNGANIHREKLLSNFSNTNFANDIQNKQNAKSLGLCAFHHYNNDKILAPLSPFYLRKSQAERLRDNNKN